ncbi:MAG: hypothetical protein GY765_00265 [bacterium]|nr:hypothetical protein [bacterium]
MSDEKKVTFELLRRYGAKWAVLAAMEVDLRKKGVLVPAETSRDIEMAHVKISSGCFSTCEAHCDLGKIEGSLVSRGASLGDEYMDDWFELLSQAMSGNLPPDKLLQIPLLKPIETKCGFLECSCGPA